MVVLVPFGPVEFVYDYDDTEGEEITEEKLLKWWQEDENLRYKLQLEEIFDKTVKCISKLGMDITILKRGVSKDNLLIDDALGVAFVKKDNPDLKNFFYIQDIKIWENY